MEALIILDIQNDFIDGNLSIPDEENKISTIISKINELLPLFDLVIFTQDWHPPTHKSFKSNGGMWETHCVQETEGAKIDQRINFNLIKGEYTFIKKGHNEDYESYSAFFDESGQSTGLKEFLKEKEVEEVYICGIAGDFCVKYTCLDATKCGFNTDCIKDLCIFIDGGDENIQKVFEELNKKNIWLLDFDTVKTFMEF